MYCFSSSTTIFSLGSLKLIITGSIALFIAQSIDVLKHFTEKGKWHNNLAYDRTETHFYSIQEGNSHIKLLDRLDLM